MPPPALTPCLPDGLLALARALPKVLLHEHLDGGLREATLLELLAARGLPAPAADVPGLAGWFDDRAYAGSLVEYLKGFDLTVAAMASPEALERVAFEAAEDARLDGCVLAEFRIAPLLFEPFGIPGDEGLELGGAHRAMLAIPGNHRGAGGPKIAILLITYSPGQVPHTGVACTRIPVTPSRTSPCAASS
jgi:hypothetical protein